MSDQYITYAERAAGMRCPSEQRPPRPERIEALNVRVDKAERSERDTARDRDHWKRRALIAENELKSLKG